ncbi:MAG TPA: transporter [Desulfobacter sp.]|jgi:predicted permease|uniref:AEC family transporter n=2 Tax=unclassified Desulfobacter TaxID=2634406 RepID=UPI000E9EEA3E|nr:AEC family transporter [Desulfobacter sp.]MBP8829616.1 AEC family transporter [Desulfobacter sp.]MBP9597977.1 AEC family transporter [Desulfobacter sp.]HAR33002.1 transporter [Desulfobacter sp.]
MIILNTLFPLLAMMALGYGLKRRGMTSDEFLHTLDKLVYYIFFPVMLFWKTAKSTGTDASEAGLILAGLAAVFLVSLFSYVYIRTTKMPDKAAGSFFQASFRFNTYIGMATVLTVLGEEGVRLFSILVGCLIPVINVLSVAVLIWHSGRTPSPGQRLGILLRALVSNPLIIGCAAGLLLSGTGYRLPGFINNFLALVASMTLPLALISMGGTLGFAGISRHWPNALAAAGIKLFILPVTGYIMLTLFSVSGTAFKTGMIYFSLPTSTAIYVLSAQLNSDVELASTAVMMSTVLSFISLSVALIL